jgi:hypothetical protein
MGGRTLYGIRIGGRVMNPKERFLELYRAHITRAGADELLAFLEKKSDFFRAPASTRFHLSCEQGLLIHSVNVAEILLSHFPEESEQSLAVCGLLHDLCKVNYYRASTRNAKNDATGQWEKVPYYQVDDSFPYGHGEKSVYMIERFFRRGPRRPWPSAGTWADLTTPWRGGSSAISHGLVALSACGKITYCGSRSYIFARRERKI